MCVQHLHLEWELEKRHPEQFVPRYSMVMFRHIPYAQALAKGQQQQQLVEQLLTAAGDDLTGIDWQQAAINIRKMGKHVG